MPTAEFWAHSPSAEAAGQKGGIKPHQNPSACTWELQSGAELSVSFMVGEHFSYEFFYPDQSQMCGYLSFVADHKMVGCGVTTFSKFNQQHLTGVEFWKSNH